MNVDMTEFPDPVSEDQRLKLGNIYRNPTGRLYLVIDVEDPNNIGCLEINTLGKIVGHQIMPPPAMRGMLLIGVADLSKPIMVAWYLPKK